MNHNFDIRSGNADGARDRTCARVSGSVYFCFGGNLAGSGAIVDAPGSPEKQSPDF